MQTTALVSIVSLCSHLSSTPPNKGTHLPAMPLASWEFHPSVVLTEALSSVATDHIVEMDAIGSFPSKDENLTHFVISPLPTKSYDFVGSLNNASTLDL